MAPPSRPMPRACCRCAPGRRAGDAEGRGRGRRTARRRADDLVGRPRRRAGPGARRRRHPARTRHRHALAGRLCPQRPRRRSHPHPVRRAARAARAARQAAAAAAVAGRMVRRAVADGAGARRHPGAQRPLRPRAAGRPARPGGAARRRAPRQCPGLRRTRLAGDRPQTPVRRTGLRLRQYLLQPRPVRSGAPGGHRAGPLRAPPRHRAGGIRTERRRLLQWVVAWCGLSAAWFMGDGDDAAIDLEIARQALALLDR